MENVRRKDEWKREVHREANIPVQGVGDDLDVGDNNCRQEGGQKIYL